MEFSKHELSQIFNPRARIPLDPEPETKRYKPIERFKTFLKSFGGRESIKTMRDCLKYERGFDVSEETVRTYCNKEKIPYKFSKRGNNK